MTPAQLDHLKRIDAHLERLLELAAKRTPGRWDHGYGNRLVVHKKTDYTVASTSSSETVAEDCPIIPWQEQVANSEYIASCAGNAEAGWKATRAAIAAILGCRSCGGTGITSGWVPSYADPSNITMAPEAEPCCEHAKDILAAFPLKNL